MLSIITGRLFRSTILKGADAPFVMELPPYYQADLPARVPTRTFKLKVFPDRQIPRVFWYEKGLVCSLAYQDKKIMAKVMKGFEGGFAFK